MDRRKFIAGLGSLTAAGAAGIGTGAFTSVQANRGLTVDTADDSNAFLAIEAMSGDNADDYVEDGGNGTVTLDFTNTDSPGSGGGVNRDSTTIFDDLLKITNQGTNTVIVGHRQSFGPAKGALYHEDDDVSQLGDIAGDYGTPDNDGITNLDTAAAKNLPVLEPGESLENVGFFVTPDADASEDFVNGTITFTAGDQPSDIGL
ncbi:MULTISPECIES: hypothetical protein [Halolamina]|uniref:DUF1102 domain-containing protein n=1 Tax=Halolamina pelagica TaxID=699431 RepID=A0A1I5PXS9_9EURY|nr:MULTISPECIES: hypothetical protein [Halolamina]NHX34986.1 hypothetical protein [Halolamina sp. R1-12]SFP38461.1 hypothetical protein SAMN05216277_103142 [Halolamina pelagica]